MNGVITVKKQLKKLACEISMLSFLGFLPATRAVAQVVSTRADLGVATPFPVNAHRNSTNQGEASRVRIGPGDLVNISVFDAPEMSQSIRVNDLGDATLSLAGTLHLAGLTTAEAQTAIAAS